MTKKMRALLEEMEGDNRMLYEIGHRGGHYGTYAIRAVEALFPNLTQDAQDKLAEGMPDKFGAYCNYLGGGMRGAVGVSGFSSSLPAYARTKLGAFQVACKERYIELEGSMNDEEDEDGETNWDAIATRAARGSGTLSAY